MALTHHQLGERRARVARFVRPVQRFIETEVAGGIVLLVAALVALAWANSPWGGNYEALLEYHLALDLGFFSLDEPIHFWINDGLMVLFFLLMGLEIKREATVGELASVSRMAIPVAGAIGGMVAPVLIFFALVGGDPGSTGWGIPMATDIAFALGVLSLVGPRIPFGLKVLLLALAIVDDVGAILVIAVFYTQSLALVPLGVALGALLLAFLLRQAGLWYMPLYIALGIIAWGAAVESGIHATIVGVVLGLLTPVHAWYQPEGFRDLAMQILRRFHDAEGSRDRELGHEQQVSALMSLRDISQQAVAPLDRVEHDLTRLVAFVIVPIFAFANAGVAIDVATLGDTLMAPLTLGIFLGLVLGKPIGIVAGVWLAVRAGARMPAGVDWRSLIGMGLLAGIGFTVALLITDLSFDDQQLLTDAKLGILMASLVAGVSGYVVLRASRRRARRRP